MSPIAPVQAPRGRIGFDRGLAVPRIMGILNCTPDSFSDGGQFVEVNRAVEHALEMRRLGADLIDIGGESSRPGARPVDTEEELRRILPVIRKLRETAPALMISVDTRKPAVVAAVLPLGVGMINDISGGSPEIFSLVARHRASIVLMHMRGEPESMQDNTAYQDIGADVRSYLAGRAEEAIKAGIPRERILLDPGIGFGKDDEGNLTLLRELPGLASLGHRLVLGTSRKSFIGRITGAAVTDRLPGSLASLIPALGIPGIIVRVHDVAQTRQFFQIAQWIGGGP